jgi:2-polyprenyl-6-methoxyphenol hydroxylase-like FAD-dependent oxidoreductase
MLLRAIGGDDWQVAMTQQHRTTCCIAGGGPAGMVLGFLLARAGVSVVVLEKHRDFLRDFRGDTVHPSTLEIFAELGLLDEFLTLPHERADRLGGQFGDSYINLADFSHLPTRSKFIAFVPQWDLLNFIQRHASRYPGFEIEMQAEVVDLIEQGGKIVGVRAETPGGSKEIRADLVVGCDGRDSTVRARAGFEVENLGAPLDVLWFSLPKGEADTTATMGRFLPGTIFIQINRGDYWQCAYVIPKGTADRVRGEGLEAFRRKVAHVAPYFADRADTLRDWEQIKLLTVEVDRLRRWHREGLLCIGDAAHAMSPVGGVGINLAIQDAVAAANILAEPLRLGTLTDADLAKVQDRREWPAKATQWLQIQIQNRVISPTLRGDSELEPPAPIRMLNRVRLLQRIPARVIGLGIRPEHVRTPEHYPESGMSRQAAAQ